MVSFSEQLRALAGVKLMTTSWNGQSVSPFYEVYQKQKGAIDKAVTEAAKSSAAEMGKQFFDVYALSVPYQERKKSA
jgi:hypothetical protein